MTQLELAMSDDDLYRALLERDPAYDGLVFVGVHSTGIFCRLTCAARKPKRENTVFFRSIRECLDAGFRPCLRCRPMAVHAGSSPLVDALLDALEQEPDRRWSEQCLTERGYDPSTVRRAFRKAYGMTFLDFARLRRVARGLEELSGGASVILAQQKAGFESGSGFRDAITRLLGHSPVDAKGKALLKADWLETPIGTMMMVADPNQLHLLEFMDRKALPNELKTLLKRSGSSLGIGRYETTERVREELGRYFKGDSAEFTCPLACEGSTFFRDVWTALRAIPAGETRTYADLAHELGRPTAVRAVARGNGANAIAIIVPCHRVIGSDGSLTGYGGGLWRKRWLLEHERRAFRLSTS